VKLSPLDRRLLRLIYKTYPIAFASEDEDAVIAIGERPLATEESILQAVPNSSPGEVSKSLATLVAFQCIQKVYLSGPKDFVEQMTTPGRIVRHCVLTSPQVCMATRSGDTERRS